MDHRDRAAPIALPRDAPVAQAILDLPLGYRLALHDLFDEVTRNLCLGGLDAEPVEQPELIITPSPV